MQFLITRAKVIDGNGVRDIDSLLVTVDGNGAPTKFEAQGVGYLYDQSQGSIESDPTSDPQPEQSLI
jgi:hypothetical protein